MAKQNFPTKSPMPKKATPQAITTDFHGAIDLILSGKRVTKIEWNNEEIYLMIVDDRLKIHKTDGLFYDLILQRADMDGKDWIII